MACRSESAEGHAIDVCDVAPFWHGTGASSGRWAVGRSGIGSDCVLDSFPLPAAFFEDPQL
ncbi:hypothetical protein M407DRAFT_245591 [Tulasnella calospora MUT 4182]|uniref:Uncharacterized protein n=1 Tax=Tulasnella calospora MUT 4182 TaxID=1051891 RepID=A0A0C3KHV4_9AGAM|nr:hypothetical protein M407DRAFT_245591 [Tulasnella calospora MUT 4182]